MGLKYCATSSANEQHRLGWIGFGVNNFELGPGGDFGERVETMRERGREGDYFVLNGRGDLGGLGIF